MVIGPINFAFLSLGPSSSGEDGFQKLKLSLRFVGVDWHASWEEPWDDFVGVTSCWDEEVLFS